MSSKIDTLESSSQVRANPAPHTPQQNQTPLMLPDTADSAFFSPVDTNTRQMYADFVAKVQKPLGFTDCKPGVVYAALSLSFNRSMVKVGFSEYNDGARVRAIENKCGQVVEQSFTSGVFVGAHRVERMFHRYLKPINYHRYNCMCGSVNEEWYDAGFEWLVGLVIAMEWWMKVRKPFHLPAGKRLQFLKEWESVAAQDPKLEERVARQMRTELKARYTFELKEEWKAALDEWHMSQFTRAPMTLHELFTKGPNIKPRSPLPATPSIQKQWSEYFEKRGQSLPLPHRRQSTPPSLRRKQRPQITQSLSTSTVESNRDPSSTSQLTILNQDSQVVAHHRSNRALDRPSQVVGFRLSLILEHCLLSLLIPLEEQVIALLSAYWSRLCQFCEMWTSNTDPEFWPPTTSLNTSAGIRCTMPGQWDDLFGGHELLQHRSDTTFGNMVEDLFLDTIPFIKGMFEHFMSAPEDFVHMENQTGEQLFTIQYSTSSSTRQSDFEIMSQQSKGFERMLSTESHNIASFSVRGTSDSIQPATPESVSDLGTLPTSRSRSMAGSSSKVQGKTPEANRISFSQWPPTPPSPSPAERRAKRRTRKSAS